MSQPDWLNDPTCGCDKIIEPDPDIAGIGVIAAFVATSLFTLICSNLLFITQLEVSGNPIDSFSAKWLKRVWHWPFRRSPIFKSTLMAAVKSFGDTQLVTGLSILITALIRLENGITLYHFTIVIDLAWLANATQSMVQYAIAIEDGYRDAKFSKWIRVIFLLAQTGLLTFASIIEGNEYWNRDWFTCQAGCFLPIAHIKFGGEGFKWFIVNTIFIIWSLGGVASSLGYMHLLTRQLVSLRNFFLKKMGIEVPLGQFDSHGALYNRIRIYWKNFLGSGCFNPNPLHYAKNFICIWCKILATVLFLLGWYFFIFLDSILLDIFMQFFWSGVNIYFLVTDRIWGTQYFQSQGETAENSRGFGQLVPNFILVIPLLAAIATYEGSKLERGADGWTKASTRGAGDGGDGNSMVPLLGSQPQ